MLMLAAKAAERCHSVLRLLIVADDLSGAADCGVSCTAAGLETVVAIAEPAGNIDADILAIDADTRAMEPAQAARQVDRLVRLYAEHPGLLLFKKIDSTLRGNVAHEVKAALDAWRDRHPGAVAVMAPAFPAIGRVTRNGLQFAHGTPLHELDIWKIQGMCGRASVPEMLACAGLRCGLLRLDAVRSAQSLADRMKSAARNADVLVCDAETDGDLAAIASASIALEPHPLWVGSAGLAYHLPHAAGIGSRSALRPLAAPPFSGPVLFVIGSLSGNSMEQVQRLVTSTETRLISVSPTTLLAGQASAEWSASASALDEAMCAGHDVVLTVLPEPRVDAAERPLLAQALARLALPARDRVGALIASGGETARAVLHAWGVMRLRLEGELERGMPVSVTESWSRRLPVITKAGDFGSPSSLVACSEFFHRARGVDAPCGAEKVGE